MAPKVNVGITYPEGCKEVTTELSKDELYRRLKVWAITRARDICNG